LALELRLEDTKLTKYTRGDETAPLATAPASLDMQVVWTNFAKTLLMWIWRHIVT